MDARQTTIYTAILIAAIVIGSILLYFIVTLMRQQRRNNKLYIAKIQAEITTLENERTRIATDLHDELGPLLSAIKMKLSSIDTQSPDDEQTMQQTSDHITDIIQRMREISNDLMPSTLVRKGLTFAIEEFIYKVFPTQSDGGSITGLTINFKHSYIPDLAKQKEINIYRMVQEIVHNAIKHSKASALDIELKTAGNKLILTSQDNGTGFDYEATLHEKTGLGLRSLASRSDVMEADLYIESLPGKGTNYIIEIPIK